MNEEIEQVRIIIEEWNPLGEKADNFKGLSGYKYEALDIHLNLRIFPQKSVKQVVKQIIEQSFDISIIETELDSVVEKISKILNRDTGYESN